MTRFVLLLLVLPSLFYSGCHKCPECTTNDPAPALKWQAQVTGLGEMVMSPFVYGDKIYYGFGLDDTKLAVYSGKDGNVHYETGWPGLRDVDAYLVEGDYLYWTNKQDILRCHLPTNQVVQVGSAGVNLAGYNEGLVVTFEGLVAGLFHEKEMNDRDYVIGVYDMATQEELFRYQVNDALTTTNLGEPAIGRTTNGDTIVTFVESTRKKLLVFNLSTQDSIEIALPENDLYTNTLRNIHVREGRIFLALRAHIFCFDAASGSEIWKFEEGVTTQVSHLRFWNDKLIFHSNAGNIYALDQATGNSIWKVENVGWAASDQIVSNNILYYTTYSADNTHRDLTGIDLDNGCVRTLIMIDGYFGGLTGATNDGYLIFATSQWFAGYLL